jgi:hypothetical protein
MFRSPSVAFFREVFYEDYITETPNPMYKYETISFSYVILNICQNTKYRVRPADTTPTTPPPYLDGDTNTHTEHGHNTHNNTTLFGCRYKHPQHHHRTWILIQTHTQNTNTSYSSKCSTYNFICILHFNIYCE